MTETVSGENVRIIFGGKNTSLNDDENYTGMTAGQTEVTDSDYANVITNNLQIFATDSGKIYESLDPMVIKPYSGSNVDIQIFGSVEEHNGAYGGEGYLRTLVNTDINLHDTAVASDGILDMDLHKGELNLNNVSVKDDGLLTADIRKGGDVTLEKVTTEGDLDSDNSDGKLIITTASGLVNVGKDNGADSFDVLIGGTANISTGNGDLTFNDTGISGTAVITTGEGDITAADLLVSETGDGYQVHWRRQYLVTDSEPNGDAI